MANNHRANLLLSGITDARTIVDFAQVIGDTEIHRESTTLDAEGWMSAAHAEHVCPVATAAGLRQLRPYQGVLVYWTLPARAGSAGLHRGALALRLGSQSRLVK